MFYTLYKSISIISMNKYNKFIFSASGIIKELTFKNYQNKINLLKSPSNILASVLSRNKPFCRTERQVDKKNLSKIFIAKNSLIVTSIRLYFSMTILFIHLMFPDPRWIKKVPDSCASAPISPSVPATHQGIFFLQHKLCTREISMSRHVLHSPGTSSVTVQTETWLKSHFSISETLRDFGRRYIKLNSIFVLISIEAFKTIKQFNHSSFQNVVFSKIFFEAFKTIKQFKQSSFQNFVLSNLLHRRRYIKLNSIFVLISIEAFKTIKQFNHSSFQNFVFSKIFLEAFKTIKEFNQSSFQSLVFSNLLHLLNLKLERSLRLSIINGKFKNLKRKSIGIYVLFHLNKNALFLYSRVLLLKPSNIGLSTRRFQK